MQAEALADASIAARQEPNLHCYICGVKQPGGRGKGKGGWHSDHDHKTHLFRGLLCNRCNSRIEWFERHRKALEAYLLNGGGDQHAEDQPS